MEKRSTNGKIKKNNPDKLVRAVGKGRKIGREGKGGMWAYMGGNGEKVGREGKEGRYEKEKNGTGRKGRQMGRKERMEGGQGRKGRKMGRS